MIITAGDLYVVKNPWGDVGYFSDPSDWHKWHKRDMQGGYYAETMFNVKNGEVIVVLESSSVDALVLTKMGIFIIARAYISNEF
mgnify:CR=1 FL=1